MVVNRNERQGSGPNGPINNKPTGRTSKHNCHSRDFMHGHARATPYTILSRLLVDESMDVFDSLIPNFVFMVQAAVGHNP